MLTNQQLEEIRERAEAATGGRWFVDICNKIESDQGLIATVPICRVNAWNGDCWRNELFIAYARQDIPALLAHVEALQAENVRLYAALQSAEHLGIVSVDFPCQLKSEPLRGSYSCRCGTKFVYVEGVREGSHKDDCPFAALEPQPEPVPPQLATTESARGVWVSEE